MCWDLQDGSLTLKNFSIFTTSFICLHWINALVHFNDDLMALNRVASDGQLCADVAASFMLSYSVCSACSHLLQGICEPIHRCGALGFDLHHPGCYGGIPKAPYYFHLTLCRL